MLMNKNLFVVEILASLRPMISLKSEFAGDTQGL